MNQAELQDIRQSLDQLVKKLDDLIELVQRQRFIVAPIKPPQKKPKPAQAEMW
jgi:hypothetical protein